jgi:cobalt/nickel transport system permease protein
MGSVLLKTPNQGQGQSQGQSQTQNALAGMDARAKLLAIGVCMLSVSAIQGLGPALATLAFALVLPPAARIPLKTAFLRLAPATVFFLLLALIFGLTYPGARLPGLAWLSLDGLEKALRIALKGYALLLAGIFLACTTSVPALSQGLQALGVPRKLTLLLALTHRQIFLVADEFQRLHRAAVTRGFNACSGLHGCKTVAVLFGQTLLRGLARAERIHAAMLLRGFAGQFHPLRPPSLQKRDIALAIVLGVVPLAICLFDRWPT